MGIGEIFQGAPEKDPEFILPPDDPEEPISNEELLRRDRAATRNLWIGLGGLTLIGAGVIGLVAYEGQHKPHIAAEVSASPSEVSVSASASASESESPSPSPTRTSSSPTPTPTLTPSPSLSPTHIPSPRATKSHKVVLPPSPTRSSSSPSHSETTQPAAACAPNENAPGEVVCTTPIWAYTSPTGNETAFQINGGAAVDCSQIEAGRIVVSISNGQGWSSLAELGNPC